MGIRTVNLKNYSSLNVGGEGKLAEFSSIKELTEILRYANAEGLRIHILGQGTNTFFGDTISNLLVVKNIITGISFEERDTEVLVTAGAGVIWDDLVRFSVEKKLWGIENLSYIPGTVGAAPVQNIGAYGVELADTFVSLSAYDVRTNNTVEINKEACAFGYRESLFKHERNRYVILSVTLTLTSVPSPVLTYKPLDSLLLQEVVTSQNVRDLVIETRKAKLPEWRDNPNSGSFFKNPVVTNAQGEALRVTYPDMPLISHPEGYKIPAAWLIEHIAHMKGERAGDVATWQNQPLVLVNYGKATAAEVLSFSEEIIQKIQEKTGILLEREVNYIL